MKRIAVLILLSGCTVVTPKQQVAEHYGPLCEQMGISKDQPRYADCVMNLMAQDKQAQQAESQSLLGAGTYMLQTAQPPVPTMTHARCYSYGNQINCVTQ